MYVSYEYVRTGVLLFGIVVLYHVERTTTALLLLLLLLLLCYILWLFSSSISPSSTRRRVRFTGGRWQSSEQAVGSRCLPYPFSLPQPRYYWYDRHANQTYVSTNHLKKDCSTRNRYYYTGMRYPIRKTNT